MGTVRVGMRKFREKLATYLLETNEAVAITRRGDTVGYYIPACRAHKQAAREALGKAATRLHELFSSEGGLGDQDSGL